MSDPGSGPARDAEVIVVGGGPAGSATAIQLAEAGHRVLLLDKARFPRHKACSEYINPSGAPLLDKLGVLDDIMRAGADRMEAMVVHAPNGERFAANYGGADPGSTYRPIAQNTQRASPAERFGPSAAGGETLAGRMAPSGL